MRDQLISVSIIVPQLFDASTALVTNSAIEDVKKMDVFSASPVSNMRRHFKNSSDANAESTIVGGPIIIPNRSHQRLYAVPGRTKKAAGVIEYLEWIGSGLRATILLHI